MILKKTVNIFTFLILLSMLIHTTVFAQSIEPYGSVVCPVFGEHHHGIGGPSYAVKYGHYEYINGEKTLVVDGNWPGDPMVRQYTCECGATIYCEGRVELGYPPLRYFTQVERIGGFAGAYEVVILESSVMYSEESNSIPGWVFYDYLFNIEHE